MYKKKYLNLSKHVRKLTIFYKILVKWLDIVLSEKSVSTYFIQREYNDVIVYGMKELGDLLVKDLKKNNINVVCGVDQNWEYIIQNIPIISPDDIFPSADVIVVSAVAYFDDIKEVLSKKTNIPILSLEEVVDNLEVFLL